LSNLFCAFLIFTARPFRVGDSIEVLDTAEKIGARGTVVDINQLYTTLEDDTSDPAGSALLQIPNALIFQRVVRRWKPGHRPAPFTAPATPQTPAPPDASAPL
jgi:small-conductance mechanosensitive channel